MHIQYLVHTGTQVTCCISMTGLTCNNICLINISLSINNNNDEFVIEDESSEQLSQVTGIHTCLIYKVCYAPFGPYFAYILEKGDGVLFTTACLSDKQHISIIYSSV